MIIVPVEPTAREPVPETVLSAILRTPLTASGPLTIRFCVRITFAFAAKVAVPVPETVIVWSAVPANVNCIDSCCRGKAKG